MPGTYLALGVFFASFVAATAQPPMPEIVGYYPSWQWYERDKLVNPATIPYEKFTIINYAFFHPLADGRVVGMDAWADEWLLRGEPGPNGVRRTETSLIAQAHRNGVKVMLSLGGWTLSHNFSLVAASAVRRARFARSCVAHLQSYDFDGIDIDWEYPGYRQHGGGPRDKRNFTLLLQCLRDSLEALGARTGKHYLLSVALPASEARTRFIEMDQVVRLVDFINLMAYDFHGPWSARSNHNAPLYPPDYGDPSGCVDAAFKLYHITLGVPAEKINLGLAFYGRAYGNCTALHARHTGRARLGGAPTFHELHQKRDLFIRGWDDRAQVPYLVSSAQRTWVSCEDSLSIALKTQYAADHALRGVFIWEITGDYLNQGTTPLLDAVHATYRNNFAVIADRHLPTPSHASASPVLPQDEAPVLLHETPLEARSGLMWRRRPALRLE